MKNATEGPERAHKVMLQPIKGFTEKENENLRQGYVEATQFTATVKNKAGFLKGLAIRSLNLEKYASWSTISEVVLKEEKENAGKKHDLTIEVSSELGISADWSYILRYLRYFGVNTY